MIPPLLMAFQIGLFLLALRAGAWCAALIVAWTRLLFARTAEADAESEKIIASQMTVPISFIIAPGDEENPEPFLARLHAALAIRHPQFEVIAALPSPRGDVVRHATQALDLKRINVVFRKVFETPPVSGIYKTPRHKNLTVLHLDGRRRGDLLNAAVNLSNYPLTYVIQGTPAPDSVAALMVPFVQHPGDCACAMGAVAPADGDRRSGAFWLDNAGRLLGVELTPRLQLRRGLPEVSLLLRKDAIIAAAGFPKTGRFEGLLGALQSTGMGPRRIVAVTRCAGVSTAHGSGGWAAKEWALGRNVRQRLGAAAAALSVLPPALELSAWGAAAAAFAAGAIGPARLAFFLAVAVGAGTALRAMALLHEEITFGVLTGSAQVRAVEPGGGGRRGGKRWAVITAIVIEHAGPRQVVLALRVVSRLAGLFKRE